MFQANPGVLLTLDNQMHGLEDGDKIEFKEIVGMTALNGTTQAVKGVLRKILYICSTGAGNLSKMSQIESHQGDVIGWSILQLATHFCVTCLPSAF